MTTHPVHDLLDRHPSWVVQAVFDPDRSGQDFSYTIGLHELGLPELHLWGSPTDGDDPGEDWSFSIRDRHGVLNEVAFRLVDGRCGIGHTWSESYDDGESVVTFTLQPPGDREFLQAFGIAPNAQVLPLSWSLRRPPIGELGPLAPNDLLAASEEYAQLFRARGADVQAPPGWGLPRFPSYDPGELFGPRTPVVLARAAQLWSAPDLLPLMRTLLPHAAEDVLTSWIARALSAARQSGRLAAAAKLEQETPNLVEHVIAADPERWARAMTGLEPDYPRRDEGSQATIEANARRWLTQAAFSTLLTEAVLDVATERTRLGGRGPWLAGFGHHSMVIGPEWAAASGIRRAVRMLLRPLDLDVWREIVAQYDAGRDAANSRYNELCWRLTLMLQTTACAMPWSKLSDLPAGREVVEAIPLPLRAATTWHAMEEWASCVAALMTHRALFSSAEVDAFVEPVRELVPGLERAVNRPR